MCNFDAFYEPRAIAPNPEFDHANFTRERDEQVLKEIVKIMLPLTFPADGKTTIDVFTERWERSRIRGSTSELRDRIMFVILNRIGIEGEQIGELTFRLRDTIQWLLIDFQASLVDRDGWHTARWYHDQYGIPPARLRKAAQRGTLPKMGKGKATVYSFAGVALRWPEDIPDET